MWYAVRYQARAPVAFGNLLRNRKTIPGASSAQATPEAAHRVPRVSPDAPRARVYVFAMLLDIGDALAGAIRVASTGQRSTHLSQLEKAYIANTTHA